MIESKEEIKGRLGEARKQLQIVMEDIERGDKDAEICRNYFALKGCSKTLGRILEKDGGNGE